MEKHIRDRVERLPRVDDQVRTVAVILQKDADGQYVEVKTTCHRSILVAKARSHDIYQSIDAAFDKVERQVARLHDKLISRHKVRQAAELDRRREQ